MSALPNPTDIADTRDARAPLRVGNCTINGALKTAMGAIFLLDDAGCTVVDIEIRSGTPVLRIDTPPSFVRGSMCVTRSNRGVREVVMVARFHGTQLEWVQRAPRVAATGGAQ